MTLKNKTIFITGANGGLGKTFIKRLINEKVKKIYCAVRSINSAKNLEILSDKIELLELDLIDTKKMEEISSNIEKIDILINNAGVNSQKRIFENSTLDYEVNVLGTLNITKYLSKKINKNGAIINITSVLALLNYPVMGLYSSSKSALHSLTQALRAEMIHNDIEVFEVLPGPIDTKMSENYDTEKACPSEIVNEVILGLENKQYEIYPDVFSKFIKNSLEKNPKNLELQFQKSIS